MLRIVFYWKAGLLDRTDSNWKAIPNYFFNECRVDLRSYKNAAMMLNALTRNSRYFTEHY